jgi:hypothetical protein
MEHTTFETVEGKIQQKLQSRKKEARKTIEISAIITVMIININK